MWTRPLNSTISITATHRMPKRVFEGTGTQVQVWMINKWKVKIVKKGLYNRRNLPWRGDLGINRESTVAISRTPVTILIQYLLEQNSSDCAENKLSLINSVHLCLIVMNTILTVIHALKPSSLTHSLQIYCIGLTGPRSHTPWAQAAKRVLVNLITVHLLGQPFRQFLCVFLCLFIF